MCVRGMHMGHGSGWLGVLVGMEGPRVDGEAVHGVTGGLGGRGRGGGGGGGAGGGGVEGVDREGVEEAGGGGGRVVEGQVAHADRRLMVLR